MTTTAFSASHAGKHENRLVIMLSALVPRLTHPSGKLVIRRGGEATRLDASQFVHALNDAVPHLPKAAWKAIAGTPIVIARDGDSLQSMLSETFPGIYIRSEPEFSCVSVYNIRETAAANR